MSNPWPSKLSAARRRGDEYELHLLAMKCLEMVLDPEITRLFHEYQPALPADDVIVESVDRIDCYQAKHASDPHALLAFDDLVNADSKLSLSVQRLRSAWDTLRAWGKDVRLHIYTNRAAGPELAKLLDKDQISSSVVSGIAQKRLRSQLQAASGISDEREFEAFLRSLRFDLRQEDLDRLRETIKRDWLERRLGLDGQSAYANLISHVEGWFLEQRSRPIEKNEVLQALRIDGGTLPQRFPVDPNTYVSRPDFERRINNMIDRVRGGYVALVGPPGSGKSTFVSRYVRSRERRRKRPVIRYYCFTEVNDPLNRRRVSADEFLKSMIEQLRQEFGHLLPKEGRYDYSLERFNQLISVLGRRFDSRGEKLLMVVDGLDHAKRADVEDAKRLLRVLPDELPPGVVCLIGTQGLQYLPREIERECRDDRTAEIPLFGLGQTTRYLRAQGELRNQLTDEQARLVHQRSEGLPLYLRYVAERLSGIGPNDLKEGLQDLPAHGGHINRYYGRLWDEFGDSHALRHLCSLVTRLRFRVPEADLLAMAGLDTFEGQQALNRIRHLLDTTEAGCRVFHNSFRDFVRGELSDGQLLQLDDEILAYLKERQGTSAWFAHAFEYAMTARNYAFLTGATKASYVEDALANGRPKSEILEALRLGLKAAVETADPVATARIAELFSHTANRVDYHLNRVQLQHTLLAIGKPDAALAAVSREGRVYDTSEDTAKALVDLALQGHRNFGNQLAKNFFDTLPAKLEDVGLIRSVGELLAVYGSFPADTLARFIYGLRDHAGLGTPTNTSGFGLLKAVLERIYQFRRYPLLRALRRLLFSKQDTDGLREEWLVQTAALEADYRPQTAEHHLRLAEKRVQNGTRRILLAGTATSVGCKRSLVMALLGDSMMFPSLENNSSNYFSTQEDFRLFRAYVAALTYCGRNGELEALHQYLQSGGTWMAAYYLANEELASALVRSASNSTLAEPNNLLAPIDRLINHRKQANERIYEVFGAIRRDLADFIERAIDGYAAVESDPGPLAKRLERLGESELISTHYGVGLAVADYSDEMAALEKVAKHPPLRSILGPLLNSLHQKMQQETLETVTRTELLLKLAETAAVCGQKSLARRWLLDGLRASGGYGYRKDMTLSLLIDAVEVMARIDPSNAERRFADIADWNNWMRRVTDGKETKWFAHYLFDAVLSFNFDLALRLLLTYRDSVAHWKFSDCLTKLLKAYDGNSTQLAYLLSEVIDETTDEGGFADKFEVRRRLIELDADRGETSSALRLATSTRRFLQCEVAPDQRAQLIPAYNSTASKRALPLLEELPLAMTEEAPSVPEAVQIGEKCLSVEDLVEYMAESIAVFAKAKEQLEDSNQLYKVREQSDEAARRLIHRASSVSELDEVADVVTQDKLVAADEHEALARAYERLGNRDRSLHHWREAFKSMHSWDLGSKRIDYLVPLIEHDPDEALRFLLRQVERFVQKYSVGFGAATLLVRALSLFNGAYRDTILRIYREFHVFVGSQFARLPKPEESAYDWLRKAPLELVSFEEAALELVFDEWKEPAVERRIVLTHLLRESAISQPQLLLPKLIRSLSSTNGTLREQSALVLNALALHDPTLVRPYAEAMSNALERPHFEVARYLIAALGSLSTTTLPTEIQTRLSTLYPTGGTPTIILPPHVLKPSQHFRNNMLPRAMTSLEATIEEVSEDLELELDEMYWRIEREMRSARYTEDEAEKEHRGRSKAYRRGNDFVPFESYASYHLRHAFAAVLERIAREKGFSLELLANLHRRTRIYDPRFPWRHTQPKPVDLVLPVFDDRYGSIGTTPEVDSWLDFEDVSALEMGDLDSEWITVLDLCFHTRRRLSEKHFAMSCFVSQEVADAVKDGTYDPQGHEGVLKLAPEPPFFTVTVEEAQNLLESSRFSDNPSLAPFFPLLCVDFGRWWYFTRSEMVGFLGRWIDHFLLEWKAPDSLDMRMGGQDVVRYTRWTDGRIADHNQYEDVGYGTRLSVSTTVLEKVLSEHDLHLLTTDHVTRTVAKSLYGGQGVERKQDKRVVRFTKPYTP